MALSESYLCTRMSPRGRLSRRWPCLRAICVPGLNPLHWSQSLKQTSLRSRIESVVEPWRRNRNDIYTACCTRTKPRAMQVEELGAPVDCHVIARYQIYPLLMLHVVDGYVGKHGLR